MATATQSTSARLRKTFKYPSDDESSDVSRDEMDEEEQENLIASFKKQEKDSNAKYVLIFSILPLLVIPSFLVYFFMPSSTKITRLLCLLGITSLLASAFSMRYLPTTMPSRPFLTTRPAPDVNQRGFGRPPPLARLPTSSITIGLPAVLTSRFPTLANTADIQLDPDGPLLRSLPFLNAGICLLLFLAAWTLKGRTSSAPEGFWLFCLLPGVMAAMIVLVRSSMKELQEGIGGLEGLKYQYRGA